MKSVEGQKGTDNNSIVFPEGQTFNYASRLYKGSILLYNINICKELKRNEHEKAIWRDSN